MAALDLVDWPADRTLALSGSAGALRLPLTLRNDSAEPAHLAEASLAGVLLRGDGAPLRLDPVPVQMHVAAHGVGRAQLRLRLDPATPPGRYEGEVKLGGLARPVTIEVLPDARLEVRPAPVVVDAALGDEQVAAAAFENRGNVPLTIDLRGVYPLGEERPVARDRLEAAAGEANPLGAILDRLTGREPLPALVPFGSLELAMPGGPVRLEPGAGATVEVALKLPPKLSPSARYHAFAPVYASDLHIVVVTAAKPSGPATPAPAAKGAEA